MFEAIERILNDARYLPKHGWHDDNKHLDGTPGYQPAMQQVRREFLDLVDVLVDHQVTQGKCLQLGAGALPNASHDVWRYLFKEAVTVDFQGFFYGEGQRKEGGNVLDVNLQYLASLRGPYDFLFLDANHDAAGVEAEYFCYERMVRKGGIIAVHDALPRTGYEEVTVWKFLETLPVKIIGTEVGIAWMVKQ